MRDKRKEKVKEIALERIWRLFELAESLGVDVEKRNNRGYAYLLMQKAGLVK